jgi:hypothetical protein
MIPVAIGSFLLLLVVAYLIAAPFLAPEATELTDEVQLAEDRDRVLALIRELDMEYETGKLSDEEYRSLRARRAIEAEEVERALQDAIAVRTAAVAALDAEPEPDAEPTPESDDDLERAIAARRRSIEADACPECDTPIDTDDHFCRSCGADLTTARTRGNP